MSMHKDRFEAIRDGRDIDNPVISNVLGSANPSTTLKSLHLQSNQRISTKFLTCPSNLIAWSINGEYLFIANESSIDIFNHSTLIHSINNAHNSKITSIQTLHYDPHKIITAGLDGAIILWDILESTPIKHITYHSPITHLLVHQNSSGRRQSTIFITLNKLAARSKAADGSDRPPVINSIYYKLIWPHSASSNSKLHSTLLGQSRPPTSISVDDNLLIAQCARKTNVSHHNVHSSHRNAFVKFISGEKHNLCTVDPLKQFFVTSEANSGKIHLWPYNKLDEMKAMKPQTAPDWHGGYQNNCPTEILHWHANAVRALTFTPQGSFLLSGGEEGVLVRWHIRQQGGRLTKRDYLPRLGAPIVSITCHDESRWVVGLADSTKLFVDGAQWRVEHAIRGVLVPNVDTSSDTPLTVTPSPHNVILPSSNPAVLQVYDMASNSTNELEVSPTNRIQGRYADGDAPRVLQAITASGWLATRDEAAVKIWQVVDGRYTLNTRIDKPHGGYAVTGIAWSGSGSGSVSESNTNTPPTLATVGTDRKCRLWLAEPLEHRPRALGKIKSVIREGQVSYSLFATVHYKDECIKQILFSPDSSLMVLVHEGALSLWDPTAVHSGRNAPSFLKVLPGEGLALDEAVFAGASHIAARATAGKRDASHGVCVVYDLTSCECIYSHSFVYSTPQILAHPSLPAFAVMSGATRPRMHSEHDSAALEREKVISRSAVCTQMTTFSVGVGEGVVKRHVAEFDNTYFKYAVLPEEVVSNLTNNHNTDKDTNTHTHSPAFNLIGLATTHDQGTRGERDSSTPALGSRGAVLIGADAAKMDLRRGDGGSKDKKKTPTSSMFEEIFGRFDEHVLQAEKRAAGESDADTHANTLVSSSNTPSNSVKHLFDGPAHLLPGPQMMYGDFLSTCLPKRARDGGDSDTATSTSVLWDAHGMDSESKEGVDVDMHTGNQATNTHPPPSNRQIGSAEVKAMSEMFKEVMLVNYSITLNIPCLFTVIVIMANTTHDDLATKLLTLINVSASRSDTPKRIRLDAPAGEKLGKKKRLSTGSEGDAQQVDAELASEDMDKDNSLENAPENPPDNAPDDDDDEESKDTLYTHFGVSPTRLTDENISKATEKQWSLKHSTNTLGRCTEYCVDDTGKDNQNVFVSPKFANKGDTHLLNLLGSYKDVFANHLSHSENESMRGSLTLHMHNHLLRTRRRVLKNNEKLAHFHAQENDKQDPQDRQDAPECLDQGFTRPKVLILTPFRNTALAWLKDLIAHSPTSQTDNKARLFQEFSLPKDAIDKMAQAPPGTYPEDHVKTFVGNIDDNFKIGLKLTRKSFKPYADFYSSDIILASPLGLKLAMEKTSDTDYLSSIEMVVGDQLDVIAMQNWQHLTDIFASLNAIPRDGHGCDFARVKPWYLDNKAKFLRQSVFLSAYEIPEMRSLFGRHCHNVEGKVRTETRYGGVLGGVSGGIKQSFYRFDVDSLLDEPDNRFAMFINKSLPALQKSAVSSSHTLLFVSSYFDFVRVRNHLKATGVNYAALSEYSTNKEISRVRGAFFRNEVSFLLLTERFHFFRRYRIRGALTSFFYSLPDHAAFYPEIVNMGLDESKGIDESDLQSIALYSNSDFLKLQRIVGSTDAALMVKQGTDDRYSYN
ncbi:hypothetical protein E3P81_02004 [Wallemia ichthyophaga]|nr:hypothetical protein E3P97_02003 [Wallemia ichthyophaga]TIB32902.1 hypothetical protein E3P85_01636 [Wallemia ichthyophaga]TIB46862.1 hypothetical protein E3P82_02001 [Wallemia ichthyophaga]TIB51079.1 hypothetical protein E3P81_02004 [Wallemia ichthyophaga]TIB53854.1 hypothetical protein E3P80_02002 [Wallemia ichthyophaga]